MRSKKAVRFSVAGNLFGLTGDFGLRTATLMAFLPQSFYRKLFKMKWAGKTAGVRVKESGVKVQEPAKEGKNVHLVEWG